MLTVLISLKPGHNIKDLYRFTVSIGLHKIDSYGDQSAKYDGAEGLFSITIHEKYNRTTTENDVALITLNRKVVFNQFVRPICLLQKAENDANKTFEGETVFIAGEIMKDIMSIALYST